MPDALSVGRGVPGWPAPAARPGRGEGVEEAVDVGVGGRPAHRQPQAVVGVDAHGLEHRRRLERLGRAGAARVGGDAGPVEARAAPPAARCPRRRGTRCGAAGRPGRRRPGGPRTPACPPRRGSGRSAALLGSLGLHRAPARRRLARERQAAPSPARAGTFSSPARRARSWSPPTSRGGSRRPWRTSRAPTPGGPPNLWALTDSRSAPRSRKATGTRPTPWAASTWVSTPRSRQAATASATAGPVPPRGCPTGGAPGPCRRARRRAGRRPPPARAVDRHDGHLAVAGGGQAHGRVLDGGHHLVAAAAGRAPAGGGDGLGGPAGEHHLAGPGAQQVGHLLAGLLDHDPGGQALGVDAPRVAHHVERGDQGVAATGRNGEVEA